MTGQLEPALEERALPHDITAEQAVLGGVLLNPDVLHEVLEIVEAADFYRPAHQVILNVATQMSDQGQALDAITVHAELVRRGEAMRVGGAPYLHTLIETVPTTANTTYYARIVAEKAQLRRLVEAGLGIAQLGYTGQGEADDLVTRGERLWQRAARLGDDDPMVTTYADLLPDLVDRMGATAEEEGLVPLPYVDLAHLLGGGLRPGQLVVVGGRPGHGKTTIALDLTRHAARAGHHVLFVNLEMTDQELGHKILAAETQVPLGKITDPEAPLNAEEWARVERHLVHRHELPITIDHDPHCTLARIRGRVSALARAGTPAGLVVIDYLQLITHAAADTREQQIAETTRSLKLLAREMKVPVLLLAQVNREAAKRDDGMPRLSDFRESGAVEQDANIALMIHNPGADDPETPRQGELDIRVAKNRGGPLGNVTVAAQLHYARCVNLARP
ncbi:replicative DNA helicase (plasmid) [Thermobifida halotolerans]|uniref:Replicative DNA helicase DnaB n=1 Tax=Thermobifida halotolerans TaxID=483545 RepID=A0A399FVI5_9ACTN|nr:replicative DNA helicase [Thermobifida halotolerans]UOE22298.1 replicative DNA helicase [Thermobifida halotolerans]